MRSYSSSSLVLTARDQADRGLGRSGGLAGDRSFSRHIAPGRTIALFLIIALYIWPLPARAQANAIESVVIAAEERGAVTLDVVYRYGGDRGDNVFLSVVMTEDGKPSPHYAYRPGRVMRGHHRTRVQLGVEQGAPPIFSTNQLRVAMYTGGRTPFLERSFLFPKTWSRPGAALQPVSLIPQFIIGRRPDLGPVEAAIETGRQREGLSGLPARRILPNGEVELRYPDGTVRERSTGCETVTRPGGTPETFCFRTAAQPPTPPSAPPDTVHARWLDAENERLLDVIRLLVGNDGPSMKHYLSQEDPQLSPYGRMGLRIQTVDLLVRP